jgi:hypothetical protein
MSKEPAMDRLTSQLNHLPSIIGRLGLNIANAQRALNADYVENVKKLVVLIHDSIGGKDAGAKEKAEALRSLLESLAPSRYQFTEATIDFSADLAETLDMTAAGAVGFGTQAIMVNAAFSLGYGYDYRAAARITAKLHAIASDPGMTKSLLKRAEDIHKEEITMPKLAQIEQELWDSVGEIYSALTNTDKEKKATPAGAVDTGGN